MRISALGAHSSLVSMRYVIKSLQVVKTLFSRSYDFFHNQARFSHALRFSPLILLHVFEGISYVFLNQYFGTLFR